MKYLSEFVELIITIVRLSFCFYLFFVLFKFFLAVDYDILYIRHFTPQNWLNILFQAAGVFFIINFSKEYVNYN